MAIPLEECMSHTVYELHSRNLSLGVFNPQTQGFIGIRTKFDSRYLFTEYHYDTGPPFGTATPQDELGEISKDMPLWERYPQSPCVRCGERIATEGEYPNMSRRHVYTELGPAIPCDDDNPVGWAGSTYTPLFNKLEAYEEDLRQRRWTEGGREEFLDEVRRWADVEHLSDEELVYLQDKYNLGSFGLSNLIERITGRKEDT